MDNETLDVAYVPAEPLQIAMLSVEGVKRIRNVTLTPAPLGLTKIGGNNRQGKTSILDALAHALVGPEAIAAGANLINDDAQEIPGARKARARTVVKFSDGTIVERRLTDANSRTGILAITLPNGCEGSLQDLKNCISKVALVPARMEAMTERERLKHLLGGVHVVLDDLEAKLDKVNKERQDLFQKKELAQRHADDLPFHEGCPTTEVQAGDIMNQLQAAMDANSTNRAKRDEAGLKRKQAEALGERLEQQRKREADLQAQLDQARKMRGEMEVDYAEATDAARNAVSKASQLIDIQTDELKTKLTDIDGLNKKIRDNQTKEKRNADAADLRAKWVAKESEQNGVLREMKERVESSDIPVPGLGIDDSLRVVFSGQPWSNCSGMQKRVVEAAISSLYQPHARFILVDGLEAMDEPSQQAFHQWAISRNLQVIGTEVRKNYDGEDGADGICRFVIKDGLVQE